jgi:hypothetical protein
MKPKGHGAEYRVLDLALSQRLKHGSQATFVHHGIFADGGGCGKANHAPRFVGIRYSESATTCVQMAMIRIGLVRSATTDFA